ncbi:unnamed protein product [Rhizopus stolonifer]
MDAQYFSTKALYPQDIDNDKEEEQKMMRRDEKVVEFLKLLKSYTTIKNNLTRTQAELIRQHIKNKEINKEILELKENDISQVQDDYQALSQGIIETKNHLSTVRGVLLALVLESDVDWEKDDYWRECVLRLGEEIPSLEKTINLFN